MYSYKDDFSLHSLNVYNSPIYSTTEYIFFESLSCIFLIFQIYLVINRWFLLDIVLWTADYTCSNFI